MEPSNQSAPANGLSVASGFAPANISLIFQTYRGATDYETGSLGVGFTLEDGATATLRRATNPDATETTVRVAGEAWDFPTVREVLRELDIDIPLDIDIEPDCPFGCGFGMSGASALSVAFAARQLLDLDATDEQLAMAAHVSEVRSGTGLGDVGGQFTTGLMIKTEAFHPLSVFRLPINLAEGKVYTRVFGPISTKDVITSAEMLADINESGRAALRQIKNLPPRSLPDLFDISHAFARESGLLQSESVLDLIRDVRARGGQATMIMLGEAVVSTLPFDGCREVRIAEGGPHYLPEPSASAEG